MSMLGWETREVLLAECYRCESEFWIERSEKHKLDQCPFCGNQSLDDGGDGLGIQGRPFEVSA